MHQLRSTNALVRIVLVIGGSAALVLGVIGIFIPLLPTTPFLLLSSACFIRSSDKLYKWLINHRLFGKYIYSYQKYRAVLMQVKVTAILLLWCSILFSIVFVIKIFWVQLILVIIAILVSAHLLSLKIMTKEMTEALKNKAID